MGKPVHNFTKTEANSPTIGTYEQQFKQEFQNKIDNLKKQIDELQVEIDSNFG